MLWMGIDGGGSNLRVVVTDSDLRILAESHRGTVNPSSIGHGAAKTLIQDAMRETLNQFKEPILAVGIGVAGAAANHSTAWLYEIVREVLPYTLIVASSDFEIALVGATGVREGILLLAGTGSVAYGINERGEALQVGGRGYLLGDEGSGYWIGMQALRLIIGLFDGIRTGDTSLSDQILHKLVLVSPPDIIPWLYHSPTPRIQDVAKLAPLVLTAAENDVFAREIIEQAAHHLKMLLLAVIERLHMPPPDVGKIAFAGGLLQSPTLLGERVCQLLNLSAYPATLYSPATGAALLAKKTFEKSGL